MVTDITKRILLTQLLNTREELIRLKSEYESFKETFKSLAFKTLTKEEKKFIELTKSGNLPDNILLMSSDVNLSYLFPFASWLRRGWNGYDLSAEDIDLLKSLNIPIEDFDNIRYADGLLTSILADFLMFRFDTPIPKLLDISWSITPKSLIDLKKRISTEQFDELLTSIVSFANSFYEGAFILIEIKKFLDRGDVTLDYLKKNFTELYNIYEDGRKKIN